MYRSHICVHLTKDVMRGDGLINVELWTPESNGQSLLNYSILVCSTTGIRTRRLRRLLTNGTRHNNNGSCGNNSRSYTYNSNMVSRCDTILSDSAMWNNCFPQGRHCLYVSVEFTETWYAASGPTEHTRRDTVYWSFIYPVFLFLRLITPSVAKITVSVANAWTGMSNLWNVIQTERNRRTRRKHIVKCHPAHHKCHTERSRTDNRTSAVGRQHLTTSVRSQFCFFFVYLFSIFTVYESLLCICNVPPYLRVLKG
jgi:hypothetical protein